MSQQLSITEENSGQRADVAAGSVLPRLSRAYIQKLFEAGQIYLTGDPEKKLKPGHKLRLGESLQIDFEESEIDVIADIDLPVLYEDDEVIVINKPGGVISHSRGRFWNEPSVASFVRQKTGLPGDRAGIVHRLDRATSGVMICAKNSQVLTHLQKQFSLRRVSKTYLAIVDGHCQPEAAIIDMPIERNPKAPATFRAGHNGKPATTQYRVVKSGPDWDLVELKPTTGRTHQLRVHMQKFGHPVIGDQLYGGRPTERLMLHAYSLEITLRGGERRQFTAAMPDEFKKFMGQS